MRYTDVPDLKNIQTQIAQRTDIHGSQTMNPTDSDVSSTATMRRVMVLYLCILCVLIATPTCPTFCQMHYPHPFHLLVDSIYIS